jgi:hypothetical protein
MIWYVSNERGAFYSCHLTFVHFHFSSDGKRDTPISSSSLLWFNVQTFRKFHLSKDTGRYSISKLWSMYQSATVNRTLEVGILCGQLLHIFLNFFFPFLRLLYLFFRISGQARAGIALKIVVIAKINLLVIWEFGFSQCHITETWSCISSLRRWNNCQLSPTDVRQTVFGRYKR